MRTTEKAKQIADRCRDAYSADRFKNWGAVAQCLLDMDYTEQEVEAIMRSKLMRWACDMDSSGARYGQHTTGAVIRGMRGVTHRDVKELLA